MKLLPRNSYLPVVVFLVVGLIAMGAAYALSRQQQGRTAVQPAICQREACVALHGDTATPDVLTVTAGSYVQFNSADGGKHNIALAHAAVQHDDPQEYESGEFGGDEAWRVQFKKDGSYVFRDTYNPKMTVTVVVYTPGKEYKVE